jgi:serine/threonine protein kinase
MSAPAPLGVVAHYNLLERLEPSGPGELYRARDTRLGRTVTVRLLPDGFTSDPERLMATARSLSTLSHPNVITLFDVGQHEGRVYLVFEFVKGQSLRSEMSGRAVKVRTAVELAIQVADAVSDAHAAGFVHGGLSPESILVTATGHAKIPAFELAARGGFEPSGGGERLRDYESPEEARGSAPDDRSDVYSVGAILYEMLTTRRPLHRGSAAPSAANAHVPPELDAVVLRAVAPNPQSRHQSMATFAAELRALIAVLDAQPTAEGEDRVHRRGTSVARVLLTAVVILAIVALLAWMFLRS